MTDISEPDKNHVYEILKGHGDWFSAQLLRLIAHADVENKAKLRLAFPEAMQAYDDWYFKTGRYVTRKDDP